MSKRILMACLAALALASEAGAVTFSNAQFDVTAVAISDGPAGFDSLASPPLDTPVSVSVDSMSATDLATAGAIAGPGLLTTSADVAGGGGIASGAATAHFSGAFLNTGQVSLSIDFTRFDYAVGSGSAASSLFVSVTSDSVTLFQDFITGPWQFSYLPVLGTTSLLDLTLSSEVSAGFATPGIGDASALGLVTFTAAVPEASTWLLLLSGLGVLLAVRQGAARRAWLG